MDFGALARGAISRRARNDEDEIFVRRRLDQRDSVSVHLIAAKLPGVNPFHERTRPMKFLAASALALGLSLAAMTASQAMPLAPLQGRKPHPGKSSRCPAAAVRMAIAVPMAAAGRSSIARPAGIPAPTASAASATGESAIVRRRWARRLRAFAHLRLPSCYFPIKPSNSSSYFARASRNTRCPVFGITSARAFGINAASACASSAL